MAFAADPGEGGLRVFAKLAAVHWFPLFAYLGAIHYLSSMSQPPPLLQFRWDKAGHFVEFLLLAVLSSRALHRTFPALALSWVVVLSGVFGFLYGTVDEYRQSFVPGRMADFLDAVADAVGAFAGAGAYVALISRWRGRVEGLRG
ncbi:MAG: VanZ family protein [Deltaproteobacteria bacterium]|nr:VanZ family protein [Deltaproteobacteria bacterium]